MVRIGFMVGFYNLIVGIQIDREEKEIFIDLLLFHLRFKWIGRTEESGLDIREVGDM